MKATITNRKIVIEDATERVAQYIDDTLSYVDKAKQYQLRRMEKNPWQKASPNYQKVKNSIHGTLVVKKDGNYEIPSGFAYILDSIDNIEIDDRRCDTGSSVSLPWNQEPFGLRDYQTEAVDEWVDNYRGLINFATGLGKTLTAIHAIRKIKTKTLVVCPGKSIAEQFYTQLQDAFGDHRVGYMGGGKKKIRDITVGIVGTINNNLEELKQHDLGLVIFDEVHHIAADTFFNIAEHLGDVGRMFGLTATDFRSDGKDVMITAGVGPVLIKRDVVWGVKHGWLATPYFFIKEIDTKGKDYPGDKLKNYKAHILNNKCTKQIIEDDIKKFIAAGKSVLCLVDEVKHGEELSKNLGIPFATGKDKMSEEYVKQLNAGSVSGLIGTDSKISEGVDTKNVDVLILANFVASRGPVLQCIGRALRKTATKVKCIIVDYRILGSKQLARHCDTRIKIFKEITSNVKIM